VLRAAGRDMRNMEITRELALAAGGHWVIRNAAVRDVDIKRILLRSRPRTSKQHREDCLPSASPSRDRRLGCPLASFHEERPAAG
jgi:hypothetical protein